MRTILLAALLLTGFVALAPEAAAHECFERGDPLWQVNPDACRDWRCEYYPEHGYIRCYHEH